MCMAYIAQPVLRLKKMSQNDANKKQDWHVVLPLHLLLHEAICFKDWHLEKPLCVL